MMQRLQNLLTSCEHSYQNPLYPRHGTTTDFLSPERLCCHNSELIQGKAASPSLVIMFLYVLFSHSCFVRIPGSTMWKKT